MKFTNYLLLSIATVAMMIASVSCGDDEIAETPNPVVVDLNTIVVDYAIKRGSLSDEYYQQIVDQLTKRYHNEEGTSDLEEYMEKYVVAPLQAKLNEIARASGCYDFNVAITVCDGNDKEKILYSKTIVPVIPA